MLRLRRTPAPSITGCGVMTRSTVRAWSWRGAPPLPRSIACLRWLFMLRSSGGVVVA